MKVSNSQFILQIIFNFFICFSSSSPSQNEIIKIKWLININISSEKESLNYINFASYSNGDLIFQSITFPNTNTRTFIGLKKNGRGFFRNIVSNKEDYYCLMNAEQNLTKYGKYESENIVIKLGGEENNEKEYLLSVSKEDSYIEIYDFDNHIIAQK